VNDWKIRQEIYHRLNTDFDDDLNTKEVEFSDEIVNNAIRYFFGGNPIEYLDEQDLLHGNDPYFKKYSMDKEVYDEIMIKINHWSFDESAGMVPDVKSYFMKEFML